MKFILIIHGYSAEVATIDNIAEAFSKTFVCDLVLCISRTIEDKQNNTGRVLLNKSRLGPDRASSFLFTFVWTMLISSFLNLKLIHRKNLKLSKFLPKKCSINYEKDISNIIKKRKNNENIFRSYGEKQK